MTMSQSAESDVLEQITYHFCTKVGGFQEKYFNSGILASTTAELPQDSQGQINHGLAEIDNDCLYGEGFLTWLGTTLLSKNLRWRHKQNHKTTSVSLLEDQDTISHTRSYPFTRAIGLQSSSHLEHYHLGFRQLYEDARAVFMEDPTRLFLHGFYLRQAIVEFWIFDRAGAYSSVPVNVLKDPARFQGALMVYIHNSGVELGDNPFTRRVDNHISILNNSATGCHPGGRLNLDPGPFVGAEELVSAGTTAYLAKSHRSPSQQLVVKFKWKEDYEQSEGSILEKVRSRHVQKVVQLYHHEEITSTDLMRKGLIFGESQKLTLTSQASLVDESSAHVNNQVYSGAPALSPNDNPDGMQEFLIETSKDYQGIPYENRSLSCIVVYPFGTRLHNFKTPKQAIRGFRDALEGHRSLYQQGRMLHRDISIFNIMLTVDESAAEKASDTHLMGFLIDLDFAMDIDQPRTRNSFYGTPPFMGIRALQCREQTYRQDLESFLYTLIWFAVSPQSARLGENIKMSRWREEDWDELARIKLDDMTSVRFEMILKDFDPAFVKYRELARELRQALFVCDGSGNGDRDDSESLWTGTDHTLEGANSLYDKMLSAFDKAIEVDV